MAKPLGRYYVERAALARSTLVVTSFHISVVVVATAIIAVIIAMTINAAIKPYSIAVAAFVSRESRLNR